MRRGVMKRQAFTWGYYGWGCAAKRFVRAVDGLERRRGLWWPVFADVRVSRSVRAAASCDQTFERIVWRARYRWMR
jgi:hypothetical protein